MDITKMYTCIRYKEFVNYCNHHKIKSKDLIHFELKDLIQIKGVSVSLAKEILDIYHSRIQSDAGHFIYQFNKAIKDAHLKIPVALVFKDPIYKEVLKYWKNQKIDTLYDLQCFDWNELFELKGVGQSKLKNCKILYYNSFRPAQTEVYLSKINPFITPHKELFNIPVDFFFPDYILSYIRSENIYNTKDLNKISKWTTENWKHFTQAKEDMLLDCLEDLKMPIGHYLKNRLKKIKNKKGYHILLEHWKHDKSIVEIAKTLSIHKETARTLKEETIREIINLINIKRYQLRKMPTNGICMSYQTACNLVGNEDDAYILHRIIKTYKPNSFYVFSDWPVFIFSNKPLDLNASIDKLSHLLKPYFDFKKEQVVLADFFIEEGLDFLKIEDIRLLLPVLGYTSINQNSVYFNENAPKYKLYASAVLELFKDGITNSEENLDKLRSAFLKNIENETDKATWKALKQNEEIVTWDKNMLMHIENVRMPGVLALKIKNYIENCTGKDSTLSINQIFNTFKPELLKHNSSITNPKRLEGFLKYKMKQTHLIKGGKIVKKEIDQWVDVAVLKNYLSGKNHKTCIYQAMGELKLTYGEIAKIIENSQNNQIVENQSMLIDIGNLHATSISQSHLKEIVESSFINEYSNAYRLFKAGDVFFHSKAITNPKLAFYLTKYHFPNNYHFVKGLHIFKKEISKEISIPLLMELLFHNPKQIKLSQLQSKAKEIYGFPHLLTEAYVGKYLK